MPKQKLASLMQKIGRPAYQVLPTKTLIDYQAEAAASKFGGAPYFEAGDQWPICSKCSNPESFICQLDLRQAKEAQLPSLFGLLTFFYCFECFPWDAPHPGWTVRNYPEAHFARAVSIEKPEPQQSGFLKKLFQKKHSFHTSKTSIVELKSFTCYPQLDELDELADGLVPEFKSFQAEVEENGTEDFSDIYYKFIEESTAASDNFGTIIGGYSQWIQAFPPDLKCKHCQNWMRQLVQIGSEKGLDLMFGDAGCIYLSICDEHPQEISMMLQCF
ncbi:MAG: DUF1963 domain-containing protein [Candidatus Obscuribacterales bacterium]|nr:DUF1963 domain-containing protein [Candidatus Obscuribacterales bacterium]